MAVLVSAFLTPRTRELLTAAGISYIDLAGNCRIISNSPGLFIATTGLDKNPHPERRGARSLRGAVAGRIVRTLCDFCPTVGVRALAARAQADAGYVSRILAFLDREALVVRQGRAGAIDVRWQPLLERWAKDHSPFDKQNVFDYLDPRGLDNFTAKLEKLKARYAITSSAAAAAIAPVAPSRLLTCYVDDPESLAPTLGLRPAESGINVRLVVPFDPVVYERTWSRDGLRYAAHAQVAADLLRSPGRGPEEAVAMFDWMAKNPDVWRS